MHNCSLFLVFNEYCCLSQIVSLFTMFFILPHTVFTVDIRSHFFIVRLQYITISVVSSLALHLVIDFPLYFPITLPSYRLIQKDAQLFPIPVCTLGTTLVSQNLHQCCTCLTLLLEFLLFLQHRNVSYILFSPKFTSFKKSQLFHCCYLLLSFSSHYPTNSHLQ